MSHNPPCVLTGIDVGATHLHVAWLVPGGQVQAGVFDNTADGHRKLHRVLTKRGRAARVCLEATGNYFLDLACFLHESGVSVQVINPKAARHFALAQLQRAKTDAVDAQVLLRFAQQQPFCPWLPPSPARRGLREITRRLQALTHMRVEEENRLHAAQACAQTHPLVLASIEASIAMLQAQEEAMERLALEHAQAQPDLAQPLELAQSIPGIGERSAVKLLGEILLLPEDMSSAQVVAHAGLDPRPNHSGKGKPGMHISKVGNARLRAMLYMPALTCIRQGMTFHAFYQRLTEQGQRSQAPRRKDVALTAVMRKLLVLVWTLLRKNESYRAPSPRQEAAPA